MIITLYYRGSLRSNGDRKHKHELREKFSDQLRRLYPAPPPPFSFSPGIHPFGFDLERVTHPKGSMLFQVAISPQLKTVAELDIIMLRPSPPGTIIGHGGDIDNRLKTLFDSLRLPTADEIPPDKVEDLISASPPFFCLLKDDALITSVAVRTERLLDVDPVENPDEVVVIIRATPICTNTDPFPTTLS